MSIYDQKIKTYVNHSSSDGQRIIEKQAYLGYEVVSTSQIKNNLTITYRKNKDLMFYTRLNDLETKINKIDQLLNLNAKNLKAMNSQISGQLNKEKKVAKWSIILSSVIIVLMPFFTSSGSESGKFSLIKYLSKMWSINLIFIGLILLSIGWLMLIKKRSVISPYQLTQKKLNDQSDLLYDKASKISKELR